MEQAPSLTASSTTPRPSSPIPLLPQSSSSETITQSTASLPPVSPSEQPNSPTETIRPTPPPPPPLATNAPFAEIAGRANDIAEKASATATAAVERARQHGLYTGNIEEEVGQVFGTLSSWGGSLWGAAKKQAEILKTDLDKTVSQAQADLKRLQTTNVEVVRKDPEQYKAEQEAEKERLERLKTSTSSSSSSSSVTITEPTEKGKGKAREVDLTDSPIPSDIAPALPGLPPAASAFLDRLTNSTASIQNSIQQSLAQAKASNPTLSNPAQLRDQLAEKIRTATTKENFTMSLKQAEKVAEEYLKRGDQWLHEAEKWVGDAVKVVPPDQDDEGSTRHIWDGNDFYSFSTNTKNTNVKSDTGPKKGDVLFDFKARSELGGRAMAGSRKEALLRRLREDKELLLVNPEGDGETSERKEEFKAWVREKWEKVGKEEREKEEANVGGIRMALVPEHLTDEQFWQRYLFHKSMIEAEDEKRKKLLEATTQTQADDFSWDDEEDPSSPILQNKSILSTLAAVPADPAPSSANTTPSAHQPKENVAIPAQPPSISTDNKAAAQVIVPPLGQSTNTSPRDSEESYDLVSDQSGIKVESKAKQSDDEDSDWE